jgi:hypothetical protein
MQLVLVHGSSFHATPLMAFWPIQSNQSLVAIEIGNRRAP